LDKRGKRDSLSDNSLLVNVLLSLNSKFVNAPSTNWELNYEAIRKLLGFDTKEMTIFGMDVCHGPEDRSTAALVMSKSNYHQYLWVSEDQPKNKQEIVTNIGRMMQMCLTGGLNAFGGTLPKKILFYRDGVGEGMYQDVLKKELADMKEVFLKVFPPDKQPKVTWVIVQKRHHFRSVSQDANPPVGTLVDDVQVVDGEYKFKNFYLYSHYARDGTARPTHYQVLLDEIGLQNMLPDLTFALCHLHEGCNKSVSLPVPVYYADKACGRAAKYLKGKRAHVAICNSLSFL